MREAADLIHAEVGRMMGDVGRLQDRVLKLQQHHGQAGEDLRQILISTEKIGARAGRIDQLDFGDIRTDEGARDGGGAAMPAPALLKLEAGE